MEATLDMFFKGEVQQ